MPGPKQADAFYRLAEVRLNNPEARSGAVEVLERALEIAPDMPRAEVMLRKALQVGAPDERIVRLFERVARSSGSEAMLAEAIALIVGLPGMRPESLREGVELAKRIDKTHLAKTMLERAIENDGEGFRPRMPAGRAPSLPRCVS